MRYRNSNPTAHEINVDFDKFTIDGDINNGDYPISKANYGLFHTNIQTFNYARRHITEDSAALSNVQADLLLIRGRCLID
jgi:hypothetical protein